MMAIFVPANKNEDAISGTQRFPITLDFSDQMLYVLWRSRISSGALRTMGTGNYLGCDAWDVGA